MISVIHENDLEKKNCMSEHVKKEKDKANVVPRTGTLVTSGSCAWSIYEDSSYLSENFSLT